MTEYPSFRPWHIAGDPWLTYDELETLVDVADRRATARRERQQQATPQRPRRRPPRARRR